VLTLDKRLYAFVNTQYFKKFHYIQLYAENKLKIEFSVKWKGTTKHYAYGFSEVTRDTNVP
jgi:hypothetical protein